jgi:hypothetical protein
VSNKLVGVVEKINKKSDTTKGKSWTKISFQVKNQWIGGFMSKNDTDDRAKVKEGDQVEIIWKENGQYKNLETITIQQAASETPEVSASGNSTNGGTEYIPQHVRDFRQTLAGSRNAAISFVEMAVKLNALPLPKDAKKHADALLVHVNEYTDVFAKQMLSAKQEDYVTKDEVEGDQAEDDSDKE